MKRTKKECTSCNEMKYIFSRGRCQGCARIESAKKQKQKKRSPIPKVSKKYKALLKRYSPKRKAFLADRLYCEVRLDCCTGRSEVIHHRKGKDYEELYLDEEFWMASCSMCNLEIERIGALAYELGLKIKRSGK